MEYILVALICFVIGVFYGQSGETPEKLDLQIMKHLKAGKQVIICVNEDATIFNMRGDKILVKRASTTFNYEEPELYDDTPYDLVSGIANKPLNNRETSVSDKTDHSDT